jgi:flagellar protein FliT
MYLELISAPEYQGEAGIQAMRGLQCELNEALKDEDWSRVRHLDAICVLLIERVIAANREDKTTLVLALSELKGVYANLIAQCQQAVDAQACQAVGA